MTCPCSRSRFRWLRNFCSLICAVAGCCSLPPSRAQNQNIDLAKPQLNIDEEITAFAYGPDGRIVYSVRRPFKTKLYDLQHDDIWLLDTSGKRRRLLQGEKFNRGNAPFSYTVDSFRWSPNGRMIAAQLFTTTVVDDSGKAQDATVTLLLEDTGKEIRIAAGDNVIPDSSNAAWLPDNATIVYLAETVKPRALFSMKMASRTGPHRAVHSGRTFRDVVWLSGTNSVIAVEQDHSQDGPPRLQRLALAAEDDSELATLDGYAGGLSVSPSQKLAAYYVDKEVLEIRDLASPARVARLRIGLGVFRWAPGSDNRILLKRATEKKSGDLVWIDIPPLAAPSDPRDIPVSQPAFIPILNGVSFRDFAISPDARSLAVIATGKRNLMIFPIPH